jgi:hypothetical protein
MTNKTGWAAGRLFGDLAWHAGFGSEANALANGNAVLSSVIFNNDTGLDQVVDVSFVGAITSASLVAGSGVSLWLAMLAGDGTTYGDGQFTTTPQILVPPWFAFAFFPFRIGTAITSLVGTQPLLAVPPGKFKLIMLNNLQSPTLTTAQVYLRSYDQDLNA